MNRNKEPKKKKYLLWQKQTQNSEAGKNGPIPQQTMVIAPRINFYDKVFGLITKGPTKMEQCFVIPWRWQICKIVSVLLGYWGSDLTNESWCAATTAYGFYLFFGHITLNMMVFRSLMIKYSLCFKRVLQYVRACGLFREALVVFVLKIIW